VASDFPATTDELVAWTWPQIEPHYADLQKRTLTGRSSAAWLREWSALTEHVYEMRERLYVATTANTVDAGAEDRFNRFLNEIQEPAEEAEQKLKEKLLASGVRPRGFGIPLRNMRAEAEIFRQANLPLLTEEDRLANEYDKIAGAQAVHWDGEELTIAQLRPVYQEPDRARREQAWRAVAARQLADRAAINDLWRRFLGLRRRLAANAGFGDDYRAYRWQQLQRFDYTAANCYSFHEAIEKVAVPAATRIYERRRRRLGLKSLRPWDLAVDPLGRAPLRPFRTIAELTSGVAAIFHRVDPVLGAHFDTMSAEGLLDLDSRKSKAPGGYCDEFAAVHRPFIFMNAVGLHDDVQTLLHEGGHAFHVFESAGLPYVQQQNVSMEFAEVASMGMELIAAPYLASRQGGFYTDEDARRARLEHLEENILFWPYMAIVDAFQQWVYENPDAALLPDNCDATWARLWQRFTPGVDYGGLEQERMTGWHNKLHIHQNPFYYVEYGLAQLGATQVWAKALQDQNEAVAGYRRALALGGTAPLPKLYATAGARFAFDARTLGQAVALTEETIAALEQD
jgi:oligoendopeptidase F